jgi:hypothetical protein
MMCQVLRTYRQLFGVSFFEVDASQFGRDNPEGIASGAFWFYYRHGFRPLERALAGLAARERQLNARRPGRRSSERTLVRLAGSNIALGFGGKPPPHVYTVGARVTRLIARRHGGDRVAAEQHCIREFVARTGSLRLRDAAERRVLAEVALLAAALGIEDARRLGVLRQMVTVKPRDLFGYQRLCLEFFATGNDAI